ncbi:MAG: helicase C-terminal domain-containing protein [Candidatus Methanofastidiosia archaeon]|jgi:Rad3-related DNA helicase/HEAT repeat protein
MKNINLEGNLREPLSAKFLVYLMKSGIAKGIAKRRLLGKEDQAVITVVKNWHDISLRNDFLDILNELKPESIIYLSWMIHKNWFPKTSREILKKMNVSPVETLIKEYYGHRINKKIIIEILSSLKDPSALNFLIHNLDDSSVMKSCISALINMENIAVPILIQNLNDEQRRGSIIGILAYNHKYSIKPLVKSLYNNKLNKFSAICLSKIGEPAASTLIDFSTDPKIQNIILGIMLRNPKAFINSLIKSLQNERSVHFCELAILTIGKEAIPYLGPHLKEPYAAKIEKILLKMGEQVIPYLIHWLANSNIRPRAANLLRIFGLKAVPYLINSLENSDVSQYVERILIDIDKPIHVQLIISLKKRAIQTQIKRIIIARGRSILPYLHKELEDQFNESHKAIVEILGIFKDASSIDPLIHALYHEKLKGYSKDSLSKIGKNAAPKLILKLEDEKIREDLIDLIAFFKGDSVPYLLDSLRVLTLQTYCAECLERIGEPAIKDLISLFGDLDLEQIAYRIVVKNGQSSVKYLIDSLDHKSKKEMCKKALLEIGETAVPELISNLSSIHQTEITGLLLGIGECTIPYLIQNFKKANIRPILFELVSSFELQTIPYLIKSLKNPEISDYSEKLLRAINVPIKKQLIAALEDPYIQDQIKRIIISRGPSIIPQLHLALMEEYSSSHGAIVDILSVFHDPSSTGTLIYTLSNDNLREKSEKALLMIGKKAIPELISNLKKENIRYSLTNILVELYEDSIIPLITSLQNEDIREYSAECLHMIGEPAIKELIYVLGDSSRFDIALDIIVKNSEISVKYLIEHLIDEKLMKYCSQALFEIREPAIPQLIMAMTGSRQKIIKEILIEMGSIAVPYLTGALKNDELRPRTMLVLQDQPLNKLQSLLSLINDEEIADHIVSILKRTNQPIDQYLVYSLYDETIQTRVKEILLHRDKKALPSLHEKLKEEFQPEHICIIEILGELKHRESLEYLIMSLQYPEVLDLSKHIISEFGETAVDNLIKALDSDNVAQHATDILIEMGDCVLPHMRHSIHRVRNKKYAIYILGSLKDDCSIQILRKIQTTLEEEIYSYISCALAILGEEVDSEILIDSFKKGDDFRLKDFALKALNMNSDPGNVEDIIICLQKEEDNYYKCYLIEILSNIGDLRAVQGIVDLLKYEDDKTVRFFALKALKKFKNPQYVPQIRKNLGIDSPPAFEKWIQNNEELIEIFEKNLIFDEKETNIKELFNVYQQVFDYSSDKLERRDQQIQYTILCYEGLIHRVPVIIEGPTGIGKTRALITAFLPLILRKKGYRVLYCTRTINQLENFMEEFSDIRKSMYEKYGHSDIKVGLNIGRSNMREKTCPDRKSCEGCELKNAQDYTYNERDFFMDFDELRKVRNNGHCPLATARWVTSKRADIVACAFAFLFHERMRDWFLGDEEKRNKTILIIDEAHNFLEEVSEKPYITFVSDPKNKGNESLCNDSSHIYSLKEVAEVTQKEEIELITKRNISKTQYEQEMFDILSKIDDYGLDDYDLTDGGFPIPFESLQFSLSSFFVTLNQIIEDKIYQTPNNKILSKKDNKEFIELLNDKLIDNGFPDIESIYYQILDEIKNIRSGDKRNKYPVYHAYHIADCLIKLYKRPYEFAIRKKPGIRIKNRNEKQGNNQITKFEKVDRIEIFSIHPKKRVQEIVSDFYSCIFTSATLSPVKKVSLLLGFDRSICQKMTSPFPEQNYGCFALAGVHSGSKEFTQEKGYRFDSFEKKILLNVIDDILNYTGQNTGIFFSSKKTLQELYWAIRKLCRNRNRWILLGNDENIQADDENIQVNPKDDYKTLVDIYCNKSGKNLKGKDYRGVENKMAVYKGIGKLLGEEKIKKGVVLIDIIGGMFAEGVNYEGSEMEIGILVGLPFKSFEENEGLYNAKSEFFYMLEGDRALADNLSFRYDAFRKVAQTAGRIHRSKKDRGVILFIDERLLGIKKLIEIDDKGKAQWSYSFLSRKNVKEEWRILQKQLNNKKTVVIPAVGDKNKFIYFKKQLSEHLETVESRPLIDSKKMVTKMQKFFVGGEEL